MESIEIFQHLGIAFLLGLLTGLQRQHAESPLGGVRTFPLITVYGSVCTLLAEYFGGWIVAVGMVSVVTTIIAGNVTRISSEDDHAGVTTAAALLLMFAVGAYVPVGPWAVAVAIGGAVAILLQLKLELHGIVARLSDADVKAIMQFVLISFIILPVLPNATFGWYDVLNPREIWLMVVLVVGISLGGYLIWRFYGQDAGIVVGGILGGTISSTATTVSFSRRSRRVAASAAAASTVILISTAVSLVRVVVEMAVVGPGLLVAAIVPMSVLTGSSILLSVLAWYTSRDSEEKIPEQENPTELRSAVIFGALYAGVLFAVAATREHFQYQGLYVIAVLSGLTDMDAITLSTSRLVSAGRLSAEVGWRVIIVAMIANLGFKAGIIAMLGHRRLLSRTGLLFSVMAVIGASLIVFLP